MQPVVRTRLHPPVPDRGVPRLPLRGHLLAQALLLLPEFGHELGTEVLRLENLTDLDLGFRVRHGIRAALDPFDRVLKSGIVGVAPP